MIIRQHRDIHILFHIMNFHIYLVFRTTQFNHMIIHSSFQIINNHFSFFSVYTSLTYILFFSYSMNIFISFLCLYFMNIFFLFIFHEYSYFFVSVFTSVE